MIKSAHPPCSPPALPADAYACTYLLMLALFIGTTHGVLHWYYPRGSSLVLPTGSPFVSTVSPFLSTVTDSPFPSAVTDSPFVSTISIRFHRHGCSVRSSSNGYSRTVRAALPSIPSNYMPLMTIIPLVGVGGPGQQHACPLPLLPHNGQHLVEPPLSSAGERESAL